MIYKILPILILIIFISSCSGLLWNGQTDSLGDELTISINNPFYQTSDNRTSRALALQGKYLYIELARIDDQVIYDADTEKSITGVGLWEDTTWGGHAIVTVDLTNWTTIVDAIFKDVPRGQDLKGRVLLDTDVNTFTTGITGLYGVDGDPLSQTYNPTGSTYDEQQWVTILASDLNENAISLPIRPITLIQPTWSTSLNLSDDYVYGVAPNIPTKPLVGETSFTELNPDISTLYIRDVGYFSNISGEVVGTVDTSLRSVSTLHDIDGRTFPMSDLVLTPVADAGGSGLPGYLYRSFQLQVATLPDYSNPGYFMSSTLYSDPADGDPDDSWDVRYGILYDNFMIAGNDNGLNISWNLPFGFSPDDLQFKIIHIKDTEIVSGLDAIDTIEKIESFQSDLNLDWAYYNPLNYLDATFTLATTNSWVVILARLNAESSPFIFSREQAAPQG